MPSIIMPKGTAHRKTNVANAIRTLMLDDGQKTKLADNLVLAETVLSMREFLVLAATANGASNDYVVTAANRVTKAKARVRDCGIELAVRDATVTLTNAETETMHSLLRSVSNAANVETRNEAVAAYRYWLMATATDKANEPAPAVSDPVADKAGTVPTRKTRKSRKVAK